MTRQLVLLRAIVAALGERSTPPWWRTQFMTDTGLRAIGRIFPRTAVAAAVNSASIAAHAEHDRLVGVGGRYHLFRLPTVLEAPTADALKAAAVQSEITEALQSGTDGMLAKLDSLAGSRTVAKAEGPLSLGDAKRLSQAKAVEDLAGGYRAAFVAGTRCYPYFSEPEK
jgi:hypothetical protein